MVLSLKLLQREAKIINFSLNVLNVCAHASGLGLVNPLSDLPKQHPVSHKDSLSGSGAWQETGYYKVNITFITSY